MKTNEIRSYLLVLALSGFLVTSGFSQSIQTRFPASGATFTTVAAAEVTRLSFGKADVQTLSLDSKLMKRSMPFRVVVPAGYAASKDQYAVIYLLHGLTGHFNDWTDKSKIADYASEHKFIIVTPEGDNGWYCDSPTAANEKYESYIIEELIPEIEKRFHTLTDRGHRIIAGLSMGGYGSIKFGLKYPDKFILVGSFSGAVSATDFGGGPAPSGPNTGFMSTVYNSTLSAFGPKDGDARKANDVFALARGLTPEKVNNLPFIYESCGTEDILITSNHDFMALLAEKKVPHEFREHPGIHDWNFWDDQIREFLAVADRTIKR